MATWKLSNGRQPISTESRRAVYRVVDGLEGYRDVRHVGGEPALYGSVYELRQYHDDAGNETAPAERVILDADPQMA